MAASTHAVPVSRNTLPATRVDLYRFVHKGLRAFLTDTLNRVGRMDPGDPRDVTDTMVQVYELLVICRAHLELEERFLHPALEARQPGAARHTANDHVAHQQSFDLLASSVRDVEKAGRDDRPPAVHRLYRELSVFVAENLEHMDVEETANNTVFWDRYSDEELLALQNDLVSSIPPAQMAVFQRWMIPAMSPGERAGMLSAAKRRSDPEVFATSLDRLKPLLPESDWNKLMAALAGV